MGEHKRTGAYVPPHLRRPDVAVQDATTLPSSWTKGDRLSLAGMPSPLSIKHNASRKHCDCGGTHRDGLEFLKLVNLYGLSESPEIRVCYNSMNLFEDLIPVKFSGLSSRMKLEKMGTVQDVLGTLWNATYWYRRFAGYGKTKSRTWRMLISFLSGKNINASTLVHRSSKLRQSGIARLKNILTTVQGVLLQMYLVLDAKYQNWEFYDRVTHSLICNLIQDYGCKGTTISFFERVKSYRKDIKFIGMNTKSFTELKDLLKVDSACSFLIPLIESIESEKQQTPAIMFKIGIVCQSRAAGHPPPVVSTKALEKWKATLLTSDVKPTTDVINMIEAATNLVCDDIIKRMTKTNCSERIRLSAKESLSDSAEFYENKAVGGKLEACRHVLKDNPTLKEIDLHTGAYTGKTLVLDKSKPGEYLFMWSLNMAKSDFKELLKLRAVAVDEPGKTRVVSVSTIGHSLLLHPLAHICAEAIKLIPSSKDGFTAGNHMWEFFKRTNAHNPSASWLFPDTSRYIVGSMDLSEATDFASPWRVKIILNTFLRRLGFPRWYSIAAITALTSPRHIYKIVDESLFAFDFESVRGCFMGDPGTKSVLHLFHLVAKVIGTLIAPGAFVSGKPETKSEEKK